MTNALTMAFGMGFLFGAKVMYRSQQQAAGVAEYIPSLVERQIADALGEDGDVAAFLVDQQGQQVGVFLHGWRES